MESLKIKKYRSLGTQETYDLEVEDADHNFYCNGLVTSNSHSISYASLSAKTVYMKFKYPAEFFVSILEMADCFPDPLKIVGSINCELEDFGIELMPPNLQRSQLDFSIENNNIRYGLNSIKGISNKTLENLVEFRGAQAESKYDIFIAAKNSKLNIGALSALVYSGALGTNNRNRLALEAQSFNLLTDREKRNFIKLYQNGFEFGDDILLSIDHVVKNEITGDDGRKIMSEKRFGTFKKKFEKYKELYKHNSRYDKFCSWWFERFLLGYSYSYDLKECFETEGTTLLSFSDYKDLAPNSSFKSVGMVEEVYSGVSKKGNKYSRIIMNDSSEELQFLFCDNKNSTPLSDFIKDNDEIQKQDILVFSGSVSKDGGTFFISDAEKINKKIFTSIRQINEIQK